MKQIVQPYVTHSIEERSSGQSEDHPYDGVNDGSAGLSRTVTRTRSAIGSDGVSTIGPASSVYVTPFTEATDGYSSAENPGDQSGYAIPEDVLLVESAGTFGQRVRQVPPGGRATAGRAIESNEDQASDGYTSFRKSISNIVSPLKEEDNQRKVHASTTRQPPAFTSKKKNHSPGHAPFDDLEGTVGPDLSAKDLDGNSRSSTQSLSSGTNSASSLENDVVPEYLPKPQARSTQARNTTEDTLKKSVTVSTEKSESTATSTSVEIRPSLQLLAKFSGPIVVPDLPADKSSSSEAFIRSLEDANSVSETNVKSSKTAVFNDITASSSLMLNPLQVGITLVNAVETGGLTDDSELSAATETKGYFRDDLQQRSPSDVLAENKGNYSEVRYKDEDIQSDEGERPIEIVTQRAPDNSVEIQKSIELYHTAPVHEIHYPVEYIQHTAHLGVIETNSIGNAQRSRQQYNQDERPESRLNYGAYRGTP